MDDRYMGHKIDVVLFDFGGVIAEEGFRYGLQAIARNNGIDEDVFFNKGRDVIHSCGYVLGKSSENVFWEDLRKVTGIKGNDESLRNEILSRFIIRDWLIDIVKIIRGSKVRVGILSDQTDWLDILNMRDDFFKWFDVVFNSFYLGKNKKDPSIFDDVVNILGTKADRILFVDDDPGNVERAKQKGLNGILYIDKTEFLNEILLISPPT